MFRPDVMNKFWGKVTQSDECWIFSGARQSAGYRTLHIEGKTHLAHRVAYQIVIGAIPSGQIVCHHCENRSCVRPEHLFLGAPKEVLRNRPTAVTRFWKKVKKTVSCWEWVGGLGGKGYGRFSVRDQMHGAHRFSFELATGAPIPDGMYVCHRCDNPRCVRPEHLFLGTSSDNSRDMHTKGRNWQARRAPETAMAHV